MKSLRLLTVVLLAVLMLSIWTPAPAYAKPSGAAAETSEQAKTKLARLRVTNKTGGTLIVTFSGERSYTFSTSKQGKTTFDPVIEPGKYTVTVRASNCNGQVTLKRNVKGGTVGLPPFQCGRK